LPTLRVSNGRNPDGRVSVADLPQNASFRKNGILELPESKSGPGFGKVDLRLSGFWLNWEDDYVEGIVHRDERTPSCALRPIEEPPSSDRRLPFVILSMARSTNPRVAVVGVRIWRGSVPRRPPRRLSATGF